ncbi:MAG: hypothetical protein MI919_15080, partial [Holophagales bacterium]|nr:hypothetical protein [Holophagales bacterium]
FRETGYRAGARLAGDGGGAEASEPSRAGAGGGDADAVPDRPTLAGVLRLLLRALRSPGAAWVLVFIATYKLRESMADTMWKPFLFDSGFTAEQIGAWLGTWGLVFSLAGSFAGGILASRIGPVAAVAVTATLRATAVGGEWWLSVVGPTAGTVIGVVAAEQAFGGALTTSMFAFMMSRVDRRIGATHYTLLATVEVTGKLVAGWLSGFVADAAGYPFLFGLATLLALAFLLLLVPIARASREEASPFSD